MCRAPREARVWAVRVAATRRAPHRRSDGVFNSCDSAGRRIKEYRCGRCGVRYIRNAARPLAKMVWPRSSLCAPGRPFLPSRARASARRALACALAPPPRVHAASLAGPGASSRTPPETTSVAARAVTAGIAAPVAPSPPPQHDDAHPNRIWTLPNAMTGARMLLAPAVAWWILDGRLGAAGAGLFVAGFLDWADGVVARDGLRGREDGGFAALVAAPWAAQACAARRLEVRRARIVPQLQSGLIARHVPGPARGQGTARQHVARARIYGAGREAVRATLARSVAHGCVAGARHLMARHAAARARQLRHLRCRPSPAGPAVARACRRHRRPRRAARWR